MQGTDRYRLIVRRGPQPNQVYELDKDLMNLGRDITNNIVINDREVSRHHLRLSRSEDGFTLEDLGSTNGTFVNGKRVNGAVLLKNGDLVSLGETVTLGYELVRGEMGAAPPAQPPAQAPASPSEDPAYNLPPQSQQPPPQPQQPAAYQPPAQPQQPANPYQPPQNAPYQPPAQDEPYQQPPAGYAPPPQQESVGAYYPPPQAAYAGQPPQGYEYDPYAMREEEGGGTARLLLFGCLGLMLFCCCITIIAAVVIDAADLYCQIPVLRDVLMALGLEQCPSPAAVGMVFGLN